MSDLCLAETPVVQLNQVTTSQKQPLDPVVDPGPSPLFLAQVEARRAEKNFLGTATTPSYLRVWMTGPPSAIQQGKVDGPTPPPKFSTNSHKYWSLTEVQDFIYFVPHYVVHPSLFPARCTLYEALQVHKL